MERRNRSLAKVSSRTLECFPDEQYQKRFQDDREQWLDQGHGKCVLEKADAAAIVVSALRHFDRDRYLLDAFVVMPNHVHVLVQLAKGQALADILHSWKS